jgi:NAD(P)-dependent dehydrogenase (short-subunit alcohol dehydrogenase family)
MPRSKPANRDDLRPSGMLRSAAQRVLYGWYNARSAFGAISSGAFSSTMRALACSPRATNWPTARRDRSQFGALTNVSVVWIETWMPRRRHPPTWPPLRLYVPAPGIAVYYASKADVLSFSETLHYEPKPRGVRMSVLCPGSVPIEFQASRHRIFRPCSRAFGRTGGERRLPRS